MPRRVAYDLEELTTVPGGAEPDLLLSHYLKKHGREDLDASLDAEASNADVGVYRDDFFKKLDMLFNTLLKDVVEGRSWEEVPFDWATTSRGRRPSSTRRAAGV
jgi:hypothetical protein